jgi:hypothetical protein
MDATLPKLQAVYRRVLKIAEGVATEAASRLIAELCAASPALDGRREIHALRMRLMDCHFRIADLEDAVANYRAMHELQHGPTVHLSLTPELLHVKPKQLN